MYPIVNSRLLKTIVIGLFFSFTQAGASSFYSSDTSQTERISPAYNYDYVPDAPYELVEERLSCLNSTIPLNFNSKVKAFVDYFTVRDRAYTRMIIKRMDLYFPIFEYYLKKHNMPEELKYLAVVESGLNPKAVSRVGATGLWQFMPATGKSFRLDQDHYIDERMDPHKATEAACLYLKQLHGMFDDWELALAAYNSGPGNVRKAIRKSGYKKGFWAIYDNLLKETRSYVPQFVAIIYTMNYAMEHNLGLELPDSPIASDTVHINQYISLKPLADQLNVCLEDLEKLNPEVKRSSLPDHIKNYPLRIPADKKKFVVANRMLVYDSAGRRTNASEELLAKVDPQPQQKATPRQERVYHTVRSGDVLGKIADKYKVSVSDLRKWNNISGNMIRSGQKLTVYVGEGKAQALNNQLAQSANDKPISVPDTKIYMVQPGDTLWDISKKYEGVTIEKIKKMNNLKDNNIKVGQKLVIG